ncbi:MAG: 3-deoxy-7-phosphoheptulonate synthase [Planctomycetaceae bacterium]|nr:3-deoxy-7-phosphoheptulonate synthase [Planctomycetaceae bacterium]
MSPFHPTQDINVRETIALSSPNELKAELPLSEQGSEQIAEYREQLHDILRGEDKRLAITVGPCSIHNKDAGLEYARKLKGLADKVSDQILLVMRVYFEKPRTTVGWKGLINDPHLNDTFDIQTGMKLARSILLEITEMGLPAATELLEPITPQYIADLLTLTAIGARTTESPTHRQMASGLSMPVGYKNGTDGGLQVAIDAMVAARSPHAFLGIDAEGRTCVVHTKGNEWGHLVLRGGRSGPNYDPDSLREATEKLSGAGVSPRFVVDCSHANSNKDFSKQSVVLNEVVDQRIAGNDTIIGLMIESNLKEGNQKLTDDPSQLEYGVSITDGCIGWEETEQLILETHAKLKAAQTVPQA